MGKEVSGRARERLCPCARMTVPRGESPDRLTGSLAHPLTS
jgi:hypothetical protein